MSVRVQILGSRGSMPVGGSDFRRYGGDTVCVLVQMAGECILLDAGTGLMSLPRELMSKQALTLLLSHLHIDHLLGLPLCPYLMQPGRRLMLYSAPHGGVDAHAALRRLFSRPLWPVSLDDLPAELVYCNLPEATDVGGIHVETMEGVHSDGVTLFRLTGEGKRVVFVTDCTLTEAVLPEITRFARGCDLLLCDGQYSPSEWETRSGFGHNTWTAAATLADACGAKAARILHHDTAHTDDILDEAERTVRAICPSCSMAVQGEVIIL